ncbi:MAG: SRPBCC domain-containing protein [Burkholderiales bacterium]
MPGQSVQHISFTIERTLYASPSQVFMAWSNPSVKRRWFVGPRGQWKERIREFDFRVGGRERLVGVFLDGKTSTYDARFLDIVPEERIIYTYDMYNETQKMSISLATMLFEAAGAGTRLKYREEALILSGADDTGRREKRTNVLFDQMEASLRVKPMP